MWVLPNNERPMDKSYLWFFLSFRSPWMMSQHFSLVLVSKKWHWCIPISHESRQQQYKTNNQQPNRNITLPYYTRPASVFQRCMIIYSCFFFWEMFYLESLWSGCTFSPTCYIDAQYPKQVVNISWAWTRALALGLQAPQLALFAPCLSALFSFPLPSALFSPFHSAGCTLRSSNRTLTVLSLLLSFMPATEASPLLVNFFHIMCLHSLISNRYGHT